MQPFIVGFYNGSEVQVYTAGSDDAIKYILSHITSGVYPVPECCMFRGCDHDGTRQMFAGEDGHIIPHGKYCETHYRLWKRHAKFGVGQ